MTAFIDVLQNLGTGRRGQVAESSVVESVLMENSSDSGTLVVLGATTPESGTAAKSPDSATSIANALGILIYRPYLPETSDGYECQTGRMNDIVGTGCVWGRVENAVAVGGKVFARHTANGAGKLELGAFRADSDGGAVYTITVGTAADSSNYDVVIDGVVFPLTSGTSQTTTTIATALASLIDAHANFTASSAAAVVTVTRVAGGADIESVILDRRLTGASGAKCGLVKNAKFKSKTSGAGNAKIEIVRPVSA